jgi:hypothetical protein
VHKFGLEIAEVVYDLLIVCPFAVFWVRFACTIKQYRLVGIVGIPKTVSIQVRFGNNWNRAVPVQKYENYWRI